METGLYNRVRSHHDIQTLDAASEALITNTFIAPLPYVGNTLEPLDRMPSASDQVCSMDTNYPQTYTSWNFQSRSVITSFCSWEGEAALQQTATILQDGALNQVLNECTAFTPRQRMRLENGMLYLTKEGNYLDHIPSGAKFRSSVISGSEVAAIIRSIDSAEPAEPIFEDSFDVIEQANMPPSISTPPVEPAERSKVTKIPCRMVKSMRSSFQSGTPTSPPKSAKCLALEAYASNSEKAATQPLLSTARSPLARDLPSIQTLLSYMNLTNASHIDSIPVIRGLCYAFAQPDAAFKIDKMYNHFVRREKLDYEPQSEWLTHNRQQHRDVVNMICVTLPAYAGHLKGVDTLLPTEWPVPMMDQGWVAVPITSDMTSQPWLREYVLCFLSTTIWAGNISRRSNHRHATGNAGAYKRCSYTTIPLSHNIYIPGPTSVMLVLIDENTTATNARSHMLVEGGMRIYKGSQYVQADVHDLNEYTVDATATFYGLLGDYNTSAQRMCGALEWMESNLCVDMAFQLAFSMAAELCASMPESPFLEVANVIARRYTNPLNGAWTFGAHNFNNDNPRHSASDIDGGDLVNRSERYTRCVNGYNFGAVSPMLQHSTSLVEITNEARVVDNTVVGYQSYWTEAVPQVESPQYQAHVAHSVYRILAAIGMIEKNNYKFVLADVSGLQSVIALQSAALTLSLAVYMTRRAILAFAAKNMADYYGIRHVFSINVYFRYLSQTRELPSRNDINRVVWSGIGAEQGAIARSSARNKIASVTAGHLIYPNMHEVLQRRVNGVRSSAQEMEFYYGLSPTDITWAASICVPYFAVLQWAAKFNLDMFMAIPSTYGPIATDYQTTYVEVRAQHRDALPWYASTGNSRTSLPRVLLCRDKHIPAFLPTSLDDWAVLTTGRLGPVSENGMVCNTLSPSFRYHFRDQSSQDYVAVLSRKSQAHIALNAWSVEPTLYPDPPNLHFLSKAVAGKTERKEEPKEKPTVEKVTQVGPMQDQAIQVPLSVVPVHQQPITLTQQQTGATQPGPDPHPQQ